MDEKSPNEIIAELWVNWDMTGNERNLLEVVGMLLTRIEELEEKVFGLERSLTPAAPDRAAEAPNDALYFIRGELVDEAPEM